MPPRISDYATNRDAARVNELLLKLFRSPALHYGEWLISLLPAPDQVGMTLNQITIEQVDAFIVPISRARALAQYSLLSMLMLQVPKKNSSGVSVPTANPYHLDTADVAKLKIRINDARLTKGLAKIPLVINGAVNNQGFIDYLESEGAADTLTDGEINDLVQDARNFVKGGKNQTKVAIKFLDQGVPLPTAGGIAAQFGELWSEGEQKAYDAAYLNRNTTNPGRPLEGPELDKLTAHGCAHYRTVLETNLALLDTKDKVTAYRFNDIIRRAILAGPADLEQILTTGLGRLSIALKNVGCFAEANTLYDTVHHRQFDPEQQILPKNDPVATQGFLVRHWGNLVANCQAIFTQQVTPEVRDLLGRIDQAQVNELMQNIDRNRRAPRANEQQRRLARRLSKLMSAIEDYAEELRIAGPGAADATSIKIRQDMFAKITHHFDKLTSRTRREAIEIGRDGINRDKTFYPMP